MLKSWHKLFKSKNIQARILTRGISLNVIPALAVLLVIWIANSLANGVALTGYSRLANQDLNRIVTSLLGACKLYDSHLSDANEGARTLLDRAGVVRYDSSDKITWQAKNQVTLQTTSVQLPLMRVGPISLRPVPDFSHEAPIVDEVQALYRFSATVFQRMNNQGDMLRISTTVKKADGSRAIGTYIPAAGADGKPNPVISTVLTGKTYLGRAFVVNAWYIAAYQPLKDANGSVTGMVYTGAPEARVRDKILQFRDASSKDGIADIFITHTAGKDRGLFVYSTDPTLQDHTAWDRRDGHGDLFVQDICNKAVLSKGAISETSYWSTTTNNKPSEKILVRFVYFPSWDWVIGVQEPEREFLATPQKIQHIFLVSNFVPLLLVIISTLIALAIWKKVSQRITEQVADVLRKLEKSSEQAAFALEAIRGNADSVGESAEELSRATQSQATSAEETSATTSLISETAKRNSQSAERMLTLATGAEATVIQAKETMEDVNGAMEVMLSINDEALTIIDTINEISFATNIVALNASVEAARAGEAGRTFVFIAQEVRDLASKVKAAAQQTRKIITDSRDQVDRSTNLVSKLRDALDPMNQNADQVRTLAGDVSSISVSQAESMSQVLNAMEQMQHSTEQTVQSAMQSARDATELRVQVSTLSTSVRTVEQAIQNLNEEFLSTD